MERNITNTKPCCNFCQHHFFFYYYPYGEKNAHFVTDCVNLRPIAEFCDFLCDLLTKFSIFSVQLLNKIKIFFSKPLDKNSDCFLDRLTKFEILFCDASRNSIILRACGLVKMLTSVK